MRIGLDFDGTIAAWGGAMERWMALNGDAPFDPDRNITEQLSRDELRAMVHEILATSLTLEMRPSDDAIEVMRRLAADHELYVVTARDDAEAAWASRWIARYGAPVTDLVFTSRESKAQSCGRLRLDVLLDDTPEVLTELIAAPELATVPVLFESRFRSGDPRPPALRTVDHWHAFERVCGELAGATRAAGERR